MPIRPGMTGTGSYWWTPFKSANGGSVVVGAHRLNANLVEERMTLRSVEPTRRSVEKAWRKAEKWCERANAALRLVDEDADTT